MTSITTTTSKKQENVSEDLKAAGKKEEKEETSTPINLPSFNKLKICHISDTHSKHKYVPWTIADLKADVIVHSGDITTLGYKHELEAFLKWFGSLPFPHKIFVPGNHDRCFDPKYEKDTGASKWVLELMEEYLSNPNHYYLHNTGCQIEGINFWGSGITPWFGGDFWALNRHRGAEIKEVWEEIPMNTDVLVTHGPVQGKHDFTLQSREYVGCEDLWKTVRKVKPLVHLCGHIHEGYGHCYDMDTHYFNGSICTLQYNPTNAPWLFEADFDNKEVKIFNYG